MVTAHFDLISGLFEAATVETSYTPKFTWSNNPPRNNQPKTDLGAVMVVVSYQVQGILLGPRCRG